MALLFSWINVLEQAGNADQDRALEEGIPGIDFFAHSLLRPTHRAAEKIFRNREPKRSKEAEHFSMLSAHHQSFLPASVHVYERGMSSWEICVPAAQRETVSKISCLRLHVSTEQSPKARDQRTSQMPAASHYGNFRDPQKDRGGSAVRGREKGI